MSDKYVKQDMIRVLECGKDKAPAFVFCPTAGMAAALTHALSEKWLVPGDATFTLTSGGKRVLIQLGSRR